jgi:hypothetical protein
MMLKISREIGNVWSLVFWMAIGHRLQGGFDLEVGRPVKRVLHCNNEPEIRFLLSGIYCGLALLPVAELGENLEHLQTLYHQVRERLASGFSKDEVLSGASGGWPGPKDALLYSLVRRFHPEEVVETGVAQGVSTTFILGALEQNGSGHLTSIDLPNENPSGYTYEDGTRDPVYVKSVLGVGWLVPEAFRSRWTLKLGPSEALLPTLACRPGMFFHDSKHTYENMLSEYEWALDRLCDGGVIVSDDISWNSAFADFLAVHEHTLTPVCTEGVGVAIKLA